MGLFSFFNKNNNGYSNGADTLDYPGKQKGPDVLENVFIEKEDFKDTKESERVDSTSNENGINILFQFLEKNHESKGYDDALINPDISHMTQNIDALKNEFERTIRKLKTYYEDFAMEINFHIESRSRSGMVDTVEELTMKKTIAESHMKKILEIEEDARQNKGDSQGIIMSYTRGFKNGLSAISHHSILKRKF